MASLLTRSGASLRLVILYFHACGCTCTSSPEINDDSTNQPVCGDGELQGEEACDDGAANADDAACTSSCTVAICGDGRIWSGNEGCDDGPNNANDATCTSLCTVAVCGDGLLLADGSEACDDGVANADDAACTSACQHASCGDGLVWVGVEECDDNNTVDHDGCSSGCLMPVRRNLADAEALLIGEADTDAAGQSVSGAGDVDNDGFADLLVGAHLHDAGGPDAGAAYLILGPVEGRHDLTNVAAKLVGEDEEDQLGFSVSGAGDTNNDGYGDVLVGAHYNDGGGSDAGAAYLVLGPVSGTLDLANADARLIGEEANDLAGYSVSGAIDVNDDGYDDLIVGAFGNDTSGNAAGAAYLVLGPATGTIDLANADAKLVGAEISSFTGWSVSGAPDTDGDGLDEILVGALYDDSGDVDGGTAYLIRGPVSGIVDLATADAKLVAEAEYESASEGISGAGDVDGDGLGDVLVGAPRNDEGGLDAGAAYLIYGPVSGVIRLADADAKMVGEEEINSAGFSVSGAGDTNNDGHEDILVGALYNDEGGDGAGAAYLVLGPVSGTLDLANADLKLTGEAAFDHAGCSVAGVGDVDADGYDDVLVGGRYNDSGASNTGAAYLVLGLP